jgi:hypothetical protein
MTSSDSTSAACAKKYFAAIYQLLTKTVTKRLSDSNSFSLKKDNFRKVMKNPFTKESVPLWQNPRYRISSALKKAFLARASSPPSFSERSSWSSFSSALRVAWAEVGSGPLRKSTMP